MSDVDCSSQPLDTTILFILPQLSYLLNYFIKRNLRLARSRAYDLTVKSRGKPDSFWSKGYVEEWEQPPIIKGLNEPKGTKAKRQEGYLSWILWWPSQMVIRHCESKRSEKQSAGAYDADIGWVQSSSSPSRHTCQYSTSHLRLLLEDCTLHDPFISRISKPRRCRRLR